MDMIFRAGFLLLCGVIFASVAWLVSQEVETAQRLEAALKKPSDVYTADVSTVEKTLYIDKKAFVQFVLGQQTLHRVLLFNQNNFYSGTGDKVWGVIDPVTEQITVTGLNEHPDTDTNWNFVEVTGVSGYRINTVKDFVKEFTTPTIEVRRYTLADGRLILVCGGGW